MMPLFSVMPNNMSISYHSICEGEGLFSLVIIVALPSPDTYPRAAMAQLSHPNTQSATPSLPNPGFVSANEMLAFADFLERIKPVIEYVEAYKATLPPPLRTLVESDAECDLTPSEVMQLLKQYLFLSHISVKTTELAGFLFILEPIFLRTFWTI